MAVLIAMMQTQSVSIRRASVPFSSATVFRGVLIFALLAISFNEAASQSPPPSLSPSEALTLAIQAAARNDALSDRPGASPQDLNVLYGTEANKAGLTLRDVKQIYDDAYKSAKDSEPIYRRYRPSVGWIVAILLAIYLLATKVWKDTIYPHLKDYNDRLYRKYAGNKIFHKKSLDNYRAELISNYEKFKPPFSTERELDMNQVYVPLQVQGKTHEKPLDAFKVVEQQKRVMVTGRPGAGKSMLLKRYALSYATESAKAMPENPVPVLFPLRRLNEDNRPLVDQIATVMEEEKFLKPENFIDRSLKRGALILLFDGLDEVNTLKRTDVIIRIKEFLRQYDQCWAVITCRTAVYNGELNEVVKQTLEVQPFTDQEIQSFLYAWKSMPPGKSPEQLFGSLNDKPRIKALARNPLLLTMIVILYSDLKTFELPHSRADFYKNAVDAFLNLNKYRDQKNTFLVPQKRLVLEHLALYNQDSGAVKDQDRISIDLKTILKETEGLLPQLGLNTTDALPLLQEIVDQSGLLMAIDDGTKYQFSHLTLQEYFTASALKNDAQGLLERFRRDPSSWRETVFLWCGLDHDSTELVQAVYGQDGLTAFQCLADALKVKSELADSIIEQFKPRLGGVEDGDAIISTFALVAAGPYERNQKVFKFLSAVLSEDLLPERTLAAAKALALTNKQAAANQLAGIYETKPAVWGALTQMGDLAVNVFAERARQRNLRAIDALVRVGTPKAASTLLELLWFDESLSTGPSAPTSAIAATAAMGLAILLAQENILEHLRKQQLTTAQRFAPMYAWVWKPFEEDQSSAISVIAGRIVYLLDGWPFKRISDDGPYFDSRIAIPLAVAVRGRLTPDENSSLDDVKVRQRFFFGEEEGTEVVNQWRSQVGPRSRELFDTIRLAKPDLRYTLSTAITGSPAPTVADWENIGSPTTYDFEKSWHYRVILVMLALASILTLGSIISGFGRPIFSVANAARFLALFPAAFFWLFVIIEKKMVPPDDLLRFGGPFLGLRSFFEDSELNVKDSAEFVGAVIGIALAFTILPVHILFTSILLHRIFSWPPVVIFGLIICGGLFFLWRTGRTKERISNNPLRIIVDQISNKQSPESPLRQVV